MIRNNQKVKIVLILGYILLTILIASLYNNPAKSYEYSIYPYITTEEYLLIVSILGIIIAFVWLSSALHLKLNASYILLVLFVGIVLYSIHVLRGYYFWGGGDDPASHFAFAKFIYKSGSLWMPTVGGSYFYYRADYYPLLHIFHATLSIISDINLRVILLWLPTYFWVLYFIFMFLILRKPSKLYPYLYLVLALILAPIHSWYLNLTPNHAYNLMWFPMLIYVGARGLEDNTFRKLFCVLLIISQLWHPLALIVGVALLLVFYFPRNIDFIKKAAILVSIVFIIWISQFWPWRWFIISMSKLLSKAQNVYIGASSVTGLWGLATKYGYNPWILLLKIWGLRLVLSGIAGVVLLWDLLNKRFNFNSPSIKYGLGFILFGSAMVVIFTLPVGFSPLRLFYYLLIFGILYTLTTRAQAISDILTSERKYRLIIVFLLIVLYLASWATLYPSPYNLTPNRQTTRSELLGVAWFIHNFESQYKISGTYNLPLGRYLLIISDPYTISRLGYPFTKWYMPRSLALPPHFGYSNSTTVCERYSTPTYVILTIEDIVKYLKVTPRLQRFWYAPNDFVMFRSDEQNFIIYSSGDIVIYLAFCGGED